MLLKDGTPEQIKSETRRILESGVCEDCRFVLREGNNLAPHTPFDNLHYMYQEVRNFGY